MNFDAVEKIANAVLYEGYMLYPYRPSSTKNRQRWNFGTLYPRSFAEAQRPPESFSLTAECLVEVSQQATLTGRVRFLHLDPSQKEGGDNAWIEGVERSAEAECKVSDLLITPQQTALNIATLTGTLTLSASQLSEQLIKLNIKLANVTPAECSTREEALLFAFSSAHLLLGLDNGEFVSLLDPPPQYQAFVAECHNVGVYPVLVGEQGSRARVLCSPIILYDYPQIAPESAGDFFDGTEMDEMLSLRVLTMTDEEKAEMRAADPRSRRLLERTETLPAEHLMKLHGAIRGLRQVRGPEES